MQKEKKGDLDIGIIQQTGWIIAIIGTTLAFLDGRTAAMSLLCGAALSNISFLLLKRDLLRVLKRPDGGAKTRFMIKYYLKITLIAVILIWLIRSGNINKFYLLAGLGSVFLAITISTAVLLIRSRKNLREAL